MDPITIIGLASSAITLADTANRIAHTLIEVYRRYKDGPEDMRRMLLEATATGAVLRNIGLLLRDTDASANQAFIAEALERCNKSLQVLMTVLDRIDRSPGGRYGRLQQALRDVFGDQQQQIQKALDTLSRARLELTLAIVGGIDCNVKGVKATARRIEQAMTDDRRSAIVDWMTDAISDPSDQHIRASELRGAETGEWLFASQDWHDWAVSGNTKAIWINGIAGAGKTILISRVIHELFEMESRRAYRPTSEQHHRPEGSSRAGIVYYYCDASRSQDETTPALRWMVSQLCRMTSRELPAAVAAKYRNRGHLDGITLLQCLGSMQDWFETIFIVVDGIDQSARYYNFLSTLSALASDHRFPKVRVAVASRRYFDIETRLSPYFRSVPMDEQSILGDMQTYVNRILHSDGRFSAWSDELRGEIGHVLVSKACGMFRWIGCKLDELADLHEPGMIKSIALKEPEALDSTYEMMLARIPPADTNFAILVLIVVVAHDRLFGEAIESHILLQIVVWNMGRQREPNRKQAHQYDVDSIRRVCKGLIRLVDVGQASTISLVHPSLSVFLSSDRLRDSARDLAARYYLAEESVRNDFANMALASLQQAFRLPLPNRTPLRRKREEYFQHASDKLLRQWESHMIAEPELLQTCRLLMGLEEFEACRSDGNDTAPAGGDGNIEAAYDATYPPSSTERKAFGFLAAADRRLWKMAQGFLAEMDGDQALMTSITIRYSDAFRLWKQSRCKCPPPVASNPQRHQARSAEPLTGTIFLHCSRQDLMNRFKARKLLADSLEPETNWELLFFTVVTAHIHPQCKGQRGGCLMHRLINKYAAAKKTWRIWITPLQIAVARHDYAGATMLLGSGVSPNEVGRALVGPVFKSVGTKIPGIASLESYRSSTPLWILRNTTGVDDDLHTSLIDDGKSRSKTLYDPRARLEELLVSKKAVEKTYPLGSMMGGA